VVFYVVSCLVIAKLIIFRMSKYNVVHLMINMKPLIVDGHYSSRIIDQIALIMGSVCVSFEFLNGFNSS